MPQNSLHYETSGPAKGDVPFSPNMFQWPVQRNISTKTLALEIGVGGDEQARMERGRDKMETGVEKEVSNPGRGQFRW